MESFLALIAATLILVLIPGANVALIVANSLKRGLRVGLVTVWGTTAGVGAQLLFVVAGMTALIGVAAEVLSWIKWVGVAYLIYLGFRSWLEPAAELAGIKAQEDSARTVFWRGFGLAIVNPKTLLFNAAFLPQFVSPDSSASVQLVLLSIVFLTTLAAGDSGWAVFASKAQTVLRRYSRIRNKLVGGFLLAAGIGLALSRRTA